MMGFRNQKQASQSMDGKSNKLSDQIKPESNLLIYYVENTLFIPFESSFKCPALCFQSSLKNFVAQLFLSLPLIPKLMMAVEGLKFVSEK